MDVKSAYEKYVEAGFQPGSIVRVAMRNFLTYTDAVAYPGPELNVILGPNGTGKSALTHAICLACGGAPKSIGRSDDITQFVKRNSEHEGISYCEVDILTRADVRTVRRSINSTDKTSKWQINGRPKSQKDVKELMAQYNIDVDNLNSFMPQDKVGSFTQQSAQGILQKTLQCISLGDGSNRTLADEQSELAAYQSKSRKKQEDVNAKQAALDSLAREIQDMEPDVQRIRRRDEIKERCLLYEIKEAVVKAEECDRNIKLKQSEVNEAETKMNKAAEEIVPLETEERDLKREYKVLQKKVDGIASKVATSDSAIAEVHDNIDSCSAKMEDAVSSLGLLDQNREKLEQRLRSSEIEISRIEQLKADELKKQPEHKKELQRLTDELRQAEDTLNDVTNEETTINMKRQELQSRVVTITASMDSYSDRSQTFLRKAVGKFKDIDRAFGFIKHHRGRFVGEVLGPVGMHIKVDDVSIARMIETFVPANRLMAFLVERKEDYDFLNEELRRRQKLKINLYLVSNTDNMRGSYSPSQLHEVGEACGGVVRYLSEAVPAPSHMPILVRAFLQSFSGFHDALYLSPHKGSSMNASGYSGDKFRVLCNNKRSFSLFTLLQGGDITRIVGTKSRFNPSAHPILESSDAKKNYFLSVEDVAGESRMKELQSELDETKKAINNLEAEHSNYSGKQLNLRQQCQDIRQKRSLCQHEIKRVGLLDRDLATEQRRRNDIEKQLSKSAEAERISLRNTLRTEVREYGTSLSSFNSIAHQRIDLTVVHTVTSENLRIFRGKLAAASSELAASREALEDFRSDVLIARNARDGLKEDFKVLEKILEQIEQKCGGEKIFGQLYARCVLECPETTLEEIELRRRELTDIMERSIDNTDLLTIYEVKKKDFARKDAELRDLKLDLQQSEEHIASRVRDWKIKVKNLEHKLNILFKKFMAELRYHGEICLREIGGLDTYEMQMKVSFRDETDIAPLSGQRHSGGERAVSTIMYLMALQGLTSAPFRVVDEINQGMDERNERLAFDIIVRNSCASQDDIISNAPSRKPQYFLVSPKLLQGLRSMEKDGVTVLMVWNGPGVLPFSLRDITSRLKQRKRARSDDGDDIRGSERKSDF